MLYFVYYKIIDDSKVKKDTGTPKVLEYLAPMKFSHNFQEQILKMPFLHAS